MNAEVMILLDTVYSGRYFDVRTCRVEEFHTLQELERLCQSAQNIDMRMMDSIPLLNCPEKGKLASWRISIYAVDQDGVHGIQHASPSRHVAFKNQAEFERLLRKEVDRALKKQRISAFSCPAGSSDIPM